ncbi:MAG TPA: hypothetical protein VF230_09625 [Acidimicrobiales bacterium]
MRKKKVIAGAALAGAVVLGSASPAFAHFCTNAAKNAHAPEAGVMSTFDPTTETFTPLGPGKGGFTAIVIGGQVVGSTYANVLLPDGARNAGPGDDACDGIGNDDMLSCMGIPH